MPPFWDHRFIQPQPIPWLVWAVLAPALLYVFARAELRDRRSNTLFAMYAGFAVATLVAHATLSGVALRWWWSFPSPIPVDPAWHIQDLLRTRASDGLLVFGLVAAVYHARGPAVAGTLTPVVGPLPEPILQPIAHLKRRERCDLRSTPEIRCAESSAGSAAFATAIRLFIIPAALACPERDQQIAHKHSGQ